MDTLTLLIFFLTSVILLIGFAGQAIFKKTNVPDIIWLLLFGLILSFFLPADSKSMLVRFAGPFGTLALIMILFNAGLELDLVQFSQGIGRGLLLTILGFLVSIGVTLLVTTFLLGWPVIYGLLLGVAVGGTSSGVIIPIVSKLKLSGFVSSILTIESTATDIFVVIFAISILDLISTGTTSMVTAFKMITAAFSIGITIGLIGALLWLFFVVRIDKDVRSYLMDFTVVLLLYVFTEFIGGSGAVAALTFGLVLGNIHTVRKLINVPDEAKLARGEKAFYSELNFFTRSFFFVYLGAMFSFSDWTYLLIGLVLSLGYLLFRIPIVWLAMIGTKVSNKSKAFSASLLGRGLSAAVVSQMPLALLGGSVGAQESKILMSFSPIVLSVILFTIILTVVGVYIVESSITPVSS